MICKFCGKECKNSNSLKNHEIRCKKNPNKIKSGFEDYNKDKTKKHSNRYIKAKEEGRIINISDETRRKISETSKNRRHSEETKKKISNSYKKFLENNPSKIGWIMNHSSKMSYAEKYFKEVFENENIDLKYHLYVGRYELDFYNELHRKYVEIDGHQHTDTQYMIEHDKQRDLYLKNLGWNGIRINWSDYKKMTNIEKQNKIKEIKLFIE